MEIEKQIKEVGYSPIIPSTYCECTERSVCQSCKDMYLGNKITMKTSHIILHKGLPLDFLVFDDILKARNYIKMKYHKRRFKEEPENTFVCKNWGSKFKIVELRCK